MMRSRDYNSLEIFFLDSDLRHGAVHPAGAVQFRPGVDMYETDQALKVKMELPGVDSTNLTITISADDRVLTVAGERQETSEEQRNRIRCHHLEIYYGDFARDITLPSGVRFDRDTITATYRNGFLVVDLPKRSEPIAESRLIEVTRE